MTNKFNAIAYQVEDTREWGFLPLDLFKMKHHGENDINEFNMEKSTHVPVISTFIEGETHDEALTQLFELTNSGDSESQAFRGNFPEARSISVGDIVIFFEGNKQTAYYCNSYGWVEIEVFNFDVLPQVGMYATGWHFSDRYPYEIIEVSKSGKTIKARRLNSEPAEDYDYFSNQTYKFSSNETAKLVTFRWSDKYKLFKASGNDGGMKMLVGRARKYEDPTF